MKKKVSYLIFIIGIVLGCIALIGLTIVIMIPKGYDHEQNLRVLDMGIDFQVLAIIAAIMAGVGSILTNKE